MKFYYASSGDLQIFNDMKVRNILVSYNEYKNKPLPKGFDLMLDSGAFSVWNSKKTIDINKYISYIKLQKPKLYVNLDVIPDEEVKPRESANASLKNLEYLEKAGLHPLPVFHMYEPLEFLENYCRKYNFIGLGDIAGKPEHERLTFLHKAFDIINQRKIKVHGFGITALYLLKKFDFYSVDSTSYKLGHLGRLAIFTPFNQLKIFHFESFFEPYINDDYFLINNLDYEKVKSGDINELNKASLLAFKKMEEYVNGRSTNIRTFSFRFESSKKETRRAVRK